MSLPSATPLLRCCGGRPVVFPLCNFHQAKGGMGLVPYSDSEEEVESPPPQVKRRAPRMWKGGRESSGARPVKVARVASGSSSGGLNRR